ncbi:low temperature requirement protein A [Micromonospora krabiensis]|uniref:Low temperature requirement protein LtrA n=1 Tax=Micromonospora krabiensis TaxID=307121 RepID=A0A1C3N966_9ACTN|nr:low temperature requirement protein A [Micromonospora krabiensis]SBV29134.1 Low temperature requirement protein LtrA [Micromonospora krabiensis]
MPTLRSRYLRTEAAHRTTSFEIFFDLVFVFALTRIIEFMARQPSGIALTRGLLLFLLLWFSWSAYAWLGNEVRADVGVIRTGTLVAMAAMFLAALVIPDAWGDEEVGPGVPAPLILALAYGVVRGLHLVLYRHVSANRQLSRTLRLTAVPALLGWSALVAGALLGGNAQTLLWALAFVIDVGGGRFASRYSPWQLRSVAHFTERHRLIIIIAIGESLISIGAGVGTRLANWSVLVTALLGFAAAVCLWRLYFDRVAPAAERAFELAEEPRRGTIAGDAYSLTHFPLIAGIMYVALGIEEVLATLIHEPPDGHDALRMPAIVALYGGTALYLGGRTLFLRLTAGGAPWLPLAGAGLALVLLPVARLVPAMVALVLLVVVLIGQCEVERHARTGGRLRERSRPRPG